MEKTARTFKEENIKYLRGILGDAKVNTFLLIEASKINKTSENQEAYEIVKKCLDQMESSGDNYWWISEDKKVLGYYQLMNPILLIDFERFHEALEFLLGRPVWTHEIGLNYEGLKEEAERAFNGK